MSSLIVGSSVVSSTRSGLRKSPVSARRRRGQRLAAQLVDRPQRLDRNVAPSSPSSGRRSKTTLGRLDLGRPARRVAREDQLLAVVQAAVGEREDVLATPPSAGRGRTTRSARAACRPSRGCTAMLWSQPYSPIRPPTPGARAAACRRRRAGKACADPTPSGRGLILSPWSAGRP